MIFLDICRHTENSALLTALVEISTKLHKLSVNGPHLCKNFYQLSLRDLEWDMEVKIKSINLSMMTYTNDWDSIERVKNPGSR